MWNVDFWLNGQSDLTQSIRPIPEGTTMAQSTRKAYKASKQIHNLFTIHKYALQCRIALLAILKTNLKILYAKYRHACLRILFNELQSGRPAERWCISFCPQNSLFAQKWFSVPFLFQWWWHCIMAEMEKFVLVSCIINFDDVQVWLRLFSLSLNACKVMEAFWYFRPIFEEDHHNFAGIEIRTKLNFLYLP